MEPPSKNFDCVQSIRQIRDKLSAEIAEMSYDELAQWLRGHQYTDPSLKRLAEKAAQKPVQRTGLRLVLGPSNSS